LREALELMQPVQADPSNTEDEAVSGLASSKEEWQREIAGKMMRAASSGGGKADPSAPSSKIFRRRWLQLIWSPVPLAAALLVAACLVSVGVWRYVHPSEARLLALAYNKQRTLVLRIPGAEPVPMASGTRGATGEIAVPSELLELSLRAQRHLEQKSNSPYWHQVRGEVEILEHQGQKAWNDLEFAQTQDTNLPNLKADLAAADFEKGEDDPREQKAAEYRDAVNLYQELLSEHPVDPALLYYNLALCWERQNMIKKARESLEKALSLERSPAWRQAIQSELANLDANSANSVTDGFEAALNEVTATLLPEWSSSAEARSRITQTAAMGLRHGDRWLADWMHALHTATHAEADRHLADAVSDGNTNKADSALAQAHLSFELYQKAGNRAGLLRAKQTELFALQRLARTRDCLETASFLEGAPELASYANMQVETLLDKGACEGRNGDFVAARADLGRAESISNREGLPLARLKALTSQAEVLQHLGLASAAWQREVDGVGDCEQINCPSGRRYALLYDMVLSAQDLGEPRVAEDVMRTATDYAEASGNQVSYVFAIEKLASISGMNGDYPESANNFNRVFALTRNSDQGSMSRLYRAVCQTDQAEVLIHEGEIRAALNLLQQSGPILTASDYAPGRIAFYKSLAMAQLALGESDQALANANLAVHEAERTLATLKSPFERQEWVRENADLYAELVDVYLKRADNSAALRLWERFRSVPFANRILAESIQAPDTRIIVVARINGRYIGWLTSARTIQAQRTIVLGDVDHLQQMAATFYRLCADRDSNLADIRALGARIYEALIAPLVKASETNRHLWIELDPSLGMLPLAALTTAEGQWLIDSEEITAVPAWWSLDPASATAESSISRELHLVVLNGFTSGQNNESEATDLEKMFAHATVIDATKSSQPEILRELASARIFHFSGHANSKAQGELVLSQNDIEKPSSMNAQSLSNADMSGCHLGVLAACNTTSADPDQIEQIPDLRDALLLAGVHTVVATSWDIDDRSTHQLMLAFYEHLITGPTPARALQAAQQTMQDTPHWQHPYYWASFEIFNR
jgi:CHAT domain-containing protein